MEEFPTGTVTFLFTDLEGSTQLWEKYPEAMKPALARHDKILVAAVSEHGGWLIKTTGDGVHAVFASPYDALEAAIAAQLAISTEAWGATGPLYVRMGLHTGEAQLRGGDYYGSTLNRAARIMALAFGGQILISEATYRLLTNAVATLYRFEDKGEHRLKGLDRPERIFQVSDSGMRSEFPPLQSPLSVPNNLPQQLTEFFGRQDELKQLNDLLGEPQVRLVTLLGPGGTGKTRLSLELAVVVLDRFPDGVFFIQLAPISDPSIVPSTIAQTIGVREGGGLPPLENLKTYLRDKRVLLLLDNLEQVIESAAVMAQILQGCPDVKILVTSRIPLQITGEREFHVLPLPVPDSYNSLDELAASEAVQLFTARAKAVNPRFNLSLENAEIVAAICRRLDGLPLALEIAAARLKMLPPQAVLDRLESSMHLLKRTGRDLPDRQRTMRAAIDWSYDLLPAEVKIVFERLGVFVGGFTLEAAEAVCDPQGELDIFESLEALLNNSLLQADPRATVDVRFVMLQTIRDYAREKLAERAEYEETRKQHASYFMEESKKLFAGYYSKNSKPALDITVLEHDNYRAAMGAALENPETIHQAVEIVLNIFWFWYRCGHFHEGREWTEKILQQAMQFSPEPVSGLAMIPAGLMAMWVGDLNVALDYSRRGLDILRRDEEPKNMAIASMGAGVVLLNCGLDEEAHAHLEESVRLFNELKHLWFEAVTLVHLANVALGLGKSDEALVRLEKAERIASEHGDSWLKAFAANNKGEVARVNGDFELAGGYYRETDRLYQEADAKGDQARLYNTFGFLEMHTGNFNEADALFRKSLESFIELGNKRGIAESLAGLAGLAACQGQVEWAAPLLHAAQRLLYGFGAAWWPADRVEIERSFARIEAGIGDPEKYAALKEKGERLGLEQAIGYAERGILN